MNEYYERERVNREVVARLAHDEMLQRRLQDEEERHQRQMADAYDAAQQKIEDLRRHNQQRIEDIRRNGSPLSLIKLAEMDGHVDDEEARIVTAAHNEYVLRADKTMEMWLAKHGKPINLRRGDVLIRQEVDPSLAYELGKPMVPMLAEIDEWLLHPRRRQKLLWLAIVTPAVVACLMELL